MASNINTVLADCEKQSKQLIAEISKYHAAGILGDKAAKSLENLCAVQKETGASLEKALEATQKISTVEILASLERVTNEVASLAAVQKETGASLEKALEATQKKSTVEILASLERVTDEVAALAKETRSSVERLEQADGRLFWMAVWAGGAGTVAAIAAIICLLHR